MSKGLIGVSTAEQGRYSLFYASLIAMSRPEESVIAMSRGACIAENRNQHTQAALDMGAEWVLYLDDDHVIPHDTLSRLLAAGRDIISAHYTQRQYPFNPVLMATELPQGGFLYKQLNPTERGVIKVSAAGAGCLLVRRKVLEALTYPYWTLGQINPASWGDDLDFCKRVQKAGFDIYCDLETHIGHIMTGIVWPSFDKKHGWVANYAQDVGAPTLCQWPMPLPGDDFLGTK